MLNWLVRCIGQGFFDYMSKFIPVYTTKGWQHQTLTTSSTPDSFVKTLRVEFRNFSYIFSPLFPRYPMDTFYICDLMFSLPSTKNELVFSWGPYCNLTRFFTVIVWWTMYNMFRFCFITYKRYKEGIFLYLMNL